MNKRDESSQHPFDDKKIGENTEEGAINLTTGSRNPPTGVVPDLNENKFFHNKAELMEALMESVVGSYLSYRKALQRLISTN